MRFEREAKILSELQHPNLPRVIDYFTIGDRYYLAMDFIEGKDLGNIIKDADPQGMQEEQIVDWSLQLCDVLIYLHSRNPPIIYRDIKPSNIMIRKSDRRVILIDFGIARTIQSEDDKSLTRTAIGTMGYMAPEQYRGKADKRSDIYALGATIYHLFTGKAPIPFSLEGLNVIRPDVSRRLNAVVMTAVRTKASERFQTVEEMKKAIAGNIRVEIPVTEEVLQVDLLLNQLNSPDPNIRYIVARALQGHKENKKIIEPLIKIMLEDPDLIIRREGATILKDIEDRRVVGAFNMALKDSDREIQLMAIQVLSKFKEPESREYLMEVLSGKNKEVSLSAARCLGEMKEKRALKEIFSLLEKETSHEIQEKLEKIIDNIDDTYLNDWKKHKTHKEIKKIEKKNLSYFLMAGIILITVLILYTGYKNYSRSYEFNKLLGDGTEYFKEYDYEKSINCFSRALNIYPQSPEANLWMGKVYIYEDPEKAIFYLEKAMQLKKDYSEAFSAMGRLFLRENNPEKAIFYLEKAVDLDNSNTSGDFYLGEGYYKTGDIDKAKEVFKKILNSSQEDSDSRRKSEAWLKKLEGEKRSAREKEEIKVKLQEGENFIEKLDYISAGNIFHEIIALYPDEPDGYGGLGKIHFLQGNTEAGIKFFTEAIDRDPLYTEAYCSIAAIYMRNEDYNQAIKYLKMAEDFDPHNREIYYLTGNVYYKTGEKEKSLKAFRLFLNIESAGERGDEVKTIIEKLEKELD